MRLTELRLQDVRCLSAAQLSLHPRMNLITGDNGTGKTTLLEAIYLLGRGRSFRTRLAGHWVRRGAAGGWVAGRIEPPEHRVDVAAAQDRVTARIDGRAVESLAELSRVLPVQVIDPGIHRLVEEGPALRRRWLDWTVFHVEPTFMAHWQGYVRALRQRNAALAAGWDPVPWESELVRHGEAMTEARTRVFAELQATWVSTVADLAAVPVTLSFSAGWPCEDESLAEALERHRARDRERGLTGQGPHRCDIGLRVDGRPARDTVSRGQQKVLGAAMAMAVVRYLAERIGTLPVLLLDDPAAELDATHTAALLATAGRLGGQSVITALHPERLPALAADRVFHVERGGVKQL